MPARSVKASTLALPVALKRVTVMGSAEAVAQLEGDNEAQDLDFATRFGQNLARARERAGLSQ